MADTGQLALDLPEIATSSRWCQRQTNGDTTWRYAHPGGPFNAKNYTVERIDRATAAPFVVAHHYAGSHVACRQSFGLYRAGHMVGVASYCVSSEQALRLAFPELTPGPESLELGRLVLLDGPGNEETFFDAACRRMLFASGVAAVLSFADPVPRVLIRAGGRRTRRRVLFRGHAGLIYAAGGYKIAGRNTARTQWMFPDGRFLNGVMMQKIRRQDRGCEAAERMLVERYGARPRRAGENPATWLRDAVRDDPTVGVTLLRHRGCHRYLRALGTTRQQRHVKINTRLRPEWATLNAAATAPIGAVPAGPFPKTPDPIGGPPAWPSTNGPDATVTRASQPHRLRAT